MELLIEHGADINATDSDGKTPLHTASRKDSVDCAALLIGAVCLYFIVVVILSRADKGAHVNARDHMGWTALHEAASERSVHTAQLLIERGAQLDLADVEGGANSNNTLVYGGGGGGAIG